MEIELWAVGGAVRPAVVEALDIGAGPEDVCQQARHDGRLISIGVQEMRRST